MKTLLPFKLAKQAHGFSLAEVTIAVGITALGLISLLGLIPQGLEMSRQTAQVSVDTRVVQKILGELGMESWQNLDKYSASGNSGNRFYDDQGVEVSPNLANAPKSFVSYIVQVKVFNPDIQLPSPKGVVNENARRVVIRIASSPNTGFDFSDANRRNFRQYPGVVANSNL